MLFLLDFWNCYDGMEVLSFFFFLFYLDKYLIYSTIFELTGVWSLEETTTRMKQAFIKNMININ
jgi:hypothetical protein